MAQGIRYQSPKYQEAYIPDQLIPLMDQVGGYHQQRYDATEGQISNMYKDLYDRQIYDPNAFQQEMGNIQGKVEDINKQYKGDLSAGMSDYVRLIGKAKQSPFWKTNDIANKKLEQQSELLARYGKSALAFQKLPTSLTTKDPETGQQRYLRPDEINFDIDKMSDWDDKMDKIWTGSLKDTSTKASLPTEMIGKTPFIEIAKHHGITNTQVLNKGLLTYQGYKNTDEYAQQKKALMKGLAPGHEGNNMSADEADHVILDDMWSVGNRKKYLSDDSQIIHDSKYGQEKTPGTIDVDQTERQPARTNMEVPTNADINKPMSQTTHEKNLNFGNPDTWSYLLNKAFYPKDSKGYQEVVKPYEQKLLGKNISKYSSPYMYAATDEGKKDMPGLLNILGGITGDNIALRKQGNESNDQWHQRINTVYQNEMNRVSNVSYTEAKLRPEEQKLTTHSLLGQGAGELNPSKTIPNSDLDNYTYEVVDKNGKKTSYPATEFFNDYINKGWGDKQSRPDFVANSNIDGYTFGDQGNMWRVKYTGKPSDKIYIKKTDANQRTQLMDPISKLFAPKTTPGMQQAQAQLEFPDKITRTVVSGNIYDPKTKSFKFGMFVVDPKTGDLVRDPKTGQPYDSESTILNMSAHSDPWIYGNRYGFLENDKEKAQNP
jgi:hypothetical protein